VVIYAVFAKFQEGREKKAWENVKENLKFLKSVAYFIEKNQTI